MTDNRSVTNRIKRLQVENAFFAFKPEPEDARDSTTGAIPEEEVRESLRVYVEPSCFDEALAELTKRRAVILEGAPGTGRRTGGLALLSTFASGVVQRIQPGVTLEELHTWEYEPRTAYVVIDHVTQETGRHQDEFRWESLCTRLQEVEGSYLVITRADAARYAPAVQWDRPDESLLLGMLLSECQDDALVDEVKEALPEDWTLTSVVECCRRLVADPEDLEHALAVFNRAAVHEVAEWFAEERPRRDVVEITALAFATGLGERRFEEMADDLEEVLARHMPPPPKPVAGTGGSMPDSLVRRRRARQSAARTLVRRVRLHNGLVPVPVLQFKTEHHWRAVFEELHANYDAAFWNAVNEWARDALPALPFDADIAALARGLAGLSLVDVHETLTILDDLTRAEHRPGAAEVDCATLTLSYMANDDAVAPIALQISRAWLGQPNLYRRLAAGQALVQDLGLRYPAEAARRLWQMISQDNELSRIALGTPALLFASLVAEGRDATDLLDMVVEKVETFNSVAARRRPDGTIIPRDQRMVDLSLTMARWLLWVSGADVDTEIQTDEPTVDPGGEPSAKPQASAAKRAPAAEVAAPAGKAGNGAKPRPANSAPDASPESPKVRRTSALEYLESNPESADIIARLWVALLRNSRYRFDAMQVLWDALRGCSDRARIAPLLGAALARHFLPAVPGRVGERELFIRHFRDFDAKKRRRPEIRLEPVAELIIRFLETEFGTPQGERA